MRADQARALAIANELDALFFRPLSVLSPSSTRHDFLCLDGSWVVDHLPFPRCTHHLGRPGVRGLRQAGVFCPFLRCFALACIAACHDTTFPSILHHVFRIFAVSFLFCVCPGLGLGRRLLGSCMQTGSRMETLAFLTRTLGGMGDIWDHHLSVIGFGAFEAELADLLLFYPASDIQGLDISEISH